jgi:aspartate/methionine/tyrosine aminotransferase
MRIAARMSTIGTESAFEVSARARALEAEGRSIIHLQIGEPDFDTPAHVREAAKRALDDGQTHYPPFPGIPALREAIAADVSMRKGFAADPSQVFVTVGGKGVMLYAILGLVDPGDEVIVPDPGYPIYESLTRFVGATPVPAPIRMTDTGWTSTSPRGWSRRGPGPDHQLAGQPDRRGADARRPRADRRPAFARLVGARR